MLSSRFSQFPSFLRPSFQCLQGKVFAIGVVFGLFGASLTVWALPAAAEPVSAEPAVAEPALVEPAVTPVAQSLRRQNETPEQRSSSLLLTGEIHAASAQTLVVPQVPQWNVSLRWIAKNGTLVKQGETVAEIDDSAFTRELSQKKSAAADARSSLRHQQNVNALTLLDKHFEVAQAKINLEKAKLQAAVDREAYPLRIYQEMQLALVQRTSQYEKALDALQVHRQAGQLQQSVLEIDVAKREREILTAEQAIEALSLKAPRDGIVVTAIHPWFRRKIKSGDNVWVNLPLLRLPDLSKMEVRAWLSDVDDGRMLPGDRVSVVLDAYTQQSYGGIVTTISPIARERAINSPRRAFSVRVSLDEVNPKTMLPGMSVLVQRLLEGAH